MLPDVKSPVSEQPIDDYDLGSKQAGRFFIITVELLN